LTPWLPYLSNWFSLTAGIINGLAMALLFGKYVSLEHRTINRKAENKYKAISWGIVHILPVYAVIQPLFGSFDIDSFGNADRFRNFVFLVCLLGKVFFLYVTKDFIKEKFLHIYLHIVITKYGIPSKFYECFEIDSDEKLNINLEESEKTTPETDSI
jgi:hypothetical protein